jgi:hypothetical protein
MPKTIAQRLSALERTVAAFFGREKTRARKATKKAKTTTKRVARKVRKSSRRKGTVI